MNEKLKGILSKIETEACEMEVWVDKILVSIEHQEAFVPTVKALTEDEAKLVYEGAKANGVLDRIASKFDILRKKIA